DAGRRRGARSGSPAADHPVHARDPEHEDAGRGRDVASAAGARTGRSVIPLRIADCGLRTLFLTAAVIAQLEVVQAPAIATTRHQVTVAGSVLRYTARAGTIPIRDNDTGDVHANMFFVAYTVDRAPGAPARPVTFLWNGGPGSNSGLVHLLGFGP